MRLNPATKDYSPLAVNVWQTAGSKSGWQRNVANVRVHATTRRVVAEHFGEERTSFGSSPALSSGVAPARVLTR